MTWIRNIRLMFEQPVQNSANAYNFKTQDKTNKNIFIIFTIIYHFKSLYLRIRRQVIFNYNLQIWLQRILSRNYFYYFKTKYFDWNEEEKWRGDTFIHIDFRAWNQVYIHFNVNDKNEEKKDATHGRFYDTTEIVAMQRRKRIQWEIPAFYVAFFYIHKITKQQFVFFPTFVFGLAHHHYTQHDCFVIIYLFRKIKINDELHSNIIPKRRFIIFFKIQ